MIRYDGHRSVTDADLREAPVDTPVNVYHVVLGSNSLRGQIVRTTPDGPYTHPYTDNPPAMQATYAYPAQGRTDAVPNVSRWTCFIEGEKQTECGSWESALGFFNTLRG